MPLSPCDIADLAKLAVSKHKLNERACIGEATIIGVDPAQDTFHFAWRGGGRVGIVSYQVAVAASGTRRYWQYSRPDFRRHF